MVMLVGLAMILLASFQPWGASGTRQRSSYALVAVADRLGFISPGLFTLLARSWFAVPLGVVIALWFVLTNRILAAATVCVVVGCGALAMAQTVERSPLLALNGVSLGRLGGMMAVLASIASVMVLPTVKSRKELNERSKPHASPELGRPGRADAYAGVVTSATGNPGSVDGAAFGAAGRW
jgi:hypothetical protein